MDTNKFNGPNYNDWLRIILDFENQGYILDKPLPTALPEGSSSEERVTFDKWLEDNRKVRNIILASMTNEIQKQYNRLDDVPLIMLRMKEVYVVLDQHISILRQKHSSGPRWPKERLRPPRQKARASDAERGRRARERLLQPLLAPRVPLLPQMERAKGRLEVLSGRRQMMCACIAKEGTLEEGVSITPLQSMYVLERSIKLSNDEMILRLGDGKAVAAEAVGSLSLEESNSVEHGSIHDEFYGIAPILLGYALETSAKFLNIAPSMMVPQTPYEIWHGKPASYKYLIVWGSPAYVKRLVEYKLYSRSSLCSVLEKDFPVDSRRDEVLLEESSEEPQHDNATSFEPSVPTDGAPVLHRSTRESRPPERYGFVGLTSQLDNDPKTYEEAMSDIDSDKWLDAMKSKMDSMGSNQVWTLVDPPQGLRLVGCKWVYKCKLRVDEEVTAFKARLVTKGYTQRPGVDFEETYSPVAMAKSIQILLAIAAW
ncbi:UNVERIFIED_CONTAM: hypothetical protein Slati_2941800 [Sesamum latifolium]|uniref:Reverse transcriptase Ty1/copia-type domain-containing protein n=1 Tax=Sesamum latifolium TaxID=2727402 RepID=A0AAW2VFD3_9LAMI